MRWFRSSRAVRSRRQVRGKPQRRNTRLAIEQCEARRLLTEHRRQLDALAEALVARETLGEEEILKVTGLPRAPQLGTGMLAAPGPNGGAREIVR